MMNKSAEDNVRKPGAPHRRSYSDDPSRSSAELRSTIASASYSDGNASYNGATHAKTKVPLNLKIVENLNEDSNTNLKERTRINGNLINQEGNTKSLYRSNSSQSHPTAPLTTRYPDEYEDHYYFDHYGSTTNENTTNARDQMVKEDTRTRTPQDPFSNFSTFSTFSPQAVLESKGGLRSRTGSWSGSGSDEERQSLLIGHQKMDIRKPALQPIPSSSSSSAQSSSSSTLSFFYIIIYALLNTTMSIPSLYGYASVIFNHEIFQPHIAALSKLVIWSSAVHQLTFVIFSSLSFAKAEVQDAGLLFLSCMSNFIAQSVLDEHVNLQPDDDVVIGTILSTTIITLSIATASLGLVLMFLGKFNCANAVSYLPLPVVGGYLAFIGYFCVVAGVGLCISQSMVDGTFLSDIAMLMDRHSLILAFPGLLSGLIMMLVGRFGGSDAALPVTMAAIPVLFYVVLYVFGYSLDDARGGKWVGEVQPVASVGSLVELVDFGLVRWDLVLSSRCISVWFGMVFVVSFSSCLDVAAISMDMGEALDVNKELITVGLSNFVSGFTFGQTGSYIFSQSIFQYRTGHVSRWIGFVGALMFLSVVTSSVNLLEIVPLFFLGSTLIFIGIDLLYEWIFEVYHKLIPSEYLVLLATFVAIQMVGIDGGIILGVIVAVVEYVISTSQVSSLRRVLKQSRAVWLPHHRRLLQEVGYDSRNPQIVTLEIRETVFFGSSLLLLSRVCDEIGISASPTDMMEISFASPRHLGRSPAEQNMKSLVTALKKRRMSESSEGNVAKGGKRSRPRYVILDVSQVPNVDASAARSCFLQLAKMCNKHSVVLCAAGANNRVGWILRSHDVAYSTEEEVIIRNELLYPHRALVDTATIPRGKVLLLDSLNEALHLCENKLIYDLEKSRKKSSPFIMPPDIVPHSSMEAGDLRKTQISTIFSRILGLKDEGKKQALDAFEPGGAAKVKELEFYYGDYIFSKDENADSFYVVLAGCVEVCRDSSDDDHKSLSSSGRKFAQDNSSRSSLGEVISYLQVGGIFGYVDFSLGRRRPFNAVCSKDGTIVAQISTESMTNLEEHDPHLHQIIEKVLLQASLMELANFDVG